MEFKNVFDINSFLFSPILFYEGDWLLDCSYRIDITDNLFNINSLNVKGKNLYNEYIKNSFYKQLAMIFNSESIAKTFSAKIVISTDEQTGKKTTKFNYSTFVFEIIAGLTFVDTNGYDSVLEYFSSDIDYNTSNEVVMLKMKDFLREEARAYEDIRKNGYKSKFYEKVQEVYKLHIPLFKKLGINITLNQFIQNKIDTLSKFRVRAKDCLEFFSKKIDTDKLVECFDFDKFCLLIAYSSIYHCNMQVESTGLLDNSIVYIKHYLDAVNKYRELYPNYNPSCLYIDEAGKKQKISLLEIEKIYYALLAKHQEFGFYPIEENDVPSMLKKYNLLPDGVEDVDLSSRLGGELMVKLYEKIQLQKQLAATWEFIPSGKREDNPGPIHPYNGNGISIDEAVRRMVIGRQFIEVDSGIKYLYRLHGINTFAGYIGYIYPNGAVVFEKYYENEKTHRIARGSATYVMGIYNFLELSKLSKTEIIKKLHSDPSIKAKRIFHREDMDQWKSELMSAITGSDYSQEIIEYIESLTDETNTIDDKKKGN